MAATAINGHDKTVKYNTVFDAIEAKHSNALYTLACRALAEPYNFHRIDAGIAPAMFPDNGNADAKIILECQAQFRKYGRYTPQSIDEVLQINGAGGLLFERTMRDAEIDLPFAFELFTEIHGRWVEVQIFTRYQDWLLHDKTTEEIRILSDEVRREKGITARVIGSDGKQEFEAELFAALDGKVIDYPIKPPVKKLRSMIPYHEPGDYVIIAGRTGMGKSFFGLNYIYGASVAGIPSTYINLENTPKNVQKRIWQMHSRTMWQPNMKGTPDAEIVRLSRAWDEVKEMPFRSINPGRSLQSILNTIRQEYYERGIQLAVIDYVQLMRESTYRGNRVNELGEISAEVRSLCLELKIPLIALAQISREGEKSADNRPSISHLRSSGDLEQDAATIMLLYRPSYYNILDNEKGEPYPDNYADITIGKGRETGGAFAECRFTPIRGFFDYEEPFSQQFPVSVSHALPQSAVNAARGEDLPF